MRMLTTSRPAAGLVSVLCTVVLGLGAYGFWSANQVQLQPGLAVEQIDDGGVCPADFAVEGNADGAMCPGRGPPCRTCEIGPGIRCERLSCDPCCWICFGDDFPTCSS